MSVVTEVLSATPVTIECYRRRLAMLNGHFIYTSGDSVFEADAKPIFTAKNRIFDITSHGESIFCVTAKGDVHNINGSGSNLLNGHIGIYSAIEATGNILVVAHDMSHTIRCIDPYTLTTIQTGTVTGFARGLCAYQENSVLAIDDRDIGIFDFRSELAITKSRPLPSQPVAVIHVDNKAIVSCEDRIIRVYDLRKMSAPLKTTKPATKNGAMSLFAQSSNEIVCVGGDETLALVNINEDVGQLKRSKYLAETPFVSAPYINDNTVSLLTRGGTVHVFTDVVEFLKNRSQ